MLSSAYTLLSRETKHKRTAYEAKYLPMNPSYPARNSWSMTST